MKIIILVSSIFYILGLKISHKIDLLKRSHPVEKITIHQEKQIKPAKAIHFDEVQTETKSVEKNIDSTSME